MYSSKRSLEYYSNIRNEYQSQLINLLKGPFYSGIRTIYGQIKQDSIAKNDKNIMKNFQVALSNIPTWNKDIIDLTANKVIEKAECPYLVKLLEVVYKSNYKLLSSQGKKKKGSGSKNLEIPALNNFIHKCYCEIAREVYINPFLLCDYDLNTWELQSNLRETYRVIESSINNTIRKTLPFEKMIDLYLNDNESVASELISSDLSISYTDDYDDEEDEVSDNEEEAKEEIKKEEIKKEEVKEEEIKEEVEEEIKEEVEEEIKEDAEEEIKEEAEEEIKEEAEEEIKEEIKEELDNNSIEIEVINDKVEKNDDAESIDIVGKEPLKVGENIIEEVEELNNVVDDLDKQMEKEDVKIVNNNEGTEEEKKFEEIVEHIEEIKEKSVEPKIEEEDNDIKKIKIRPSKRSGLLFFEDADSD